MPKSITHYTFSQSKKKENKKEEKTEKEFSLITFHIFINNIKAIRSGKTNLSHSHLGRSW